MGKKKTEAAPLGGAAEEKEAAVSESAVSADVEETAGEATPTADAEPAAGAAADATEAEVRDEAADESAEEQEGGKKKRKRKRRKDMTPAERKRRRIIDWIITGTVFGVIGVFFAICALCSFVGYKGNFERIENLSPVDYVSPFELEKDAETGYWTFTGDGDFRILQLTDVHIGAGAFSAKKDSYAINAVATLVHRVKPDLVIVTGDVAYPVPFQAGTLNNKREAEMFATLMEKLGIPWTITFGNHDTEAYSLYDREYISGLYMQERWTKCLFEAGPSDVDGYGNSMILIKNTSGEIVQSLVTIDSHSYTDGDILGIAWKYDKIHDNQVDWYEAEIAKLNAINADNGFGPVKNLAFFHIPLREYGEAWAEYRAAGSVDTENVKYFYGKAGEKDEKSYPGKEGGKLFDALLRSGGQGVFCGHDHLNNYSLEYKGVRLTYGLSIDYLAYAGIVKQTEQRGGTVITVFPDGSFDCAQERLV